nr:MAG TPA: hypothetical protein [Bacteriophage sp.]DAU15344.1 MAG TPA: hypothetical protein [Caudoviricetes sp.]
MDVPTLIYFNKLSIKYFIILLSVVFNIPHVDFYIYIRRKQQWVCRNLQVNYFICRKQQVISNILCL